MISRPSDLYLTVGADVDEEHPHGDLDRIDYSGYSMYSRQDKTTIRGEDIAFLMECIQVRRKIAFNEDPYVLTFHRNIRKENLNTILDYVKEFAYRIGLNYYFTNGEEIVSTDEEMEETDYSIISFCLRKGLIFTTVFPDIPESGTTDRRILRTTIYRLLQNIRRFRYQAMFENVSGHSYHPISVSGFPFGSDVTNIGTPPTGKSYPPINPLDGKMIYHKILTRCTKYESGHVVWDGEQYGSVATIKTSMFSYINVNLPANNYHLKHISLFASVGVIAYLPNEEMKVTSFVCPLYSVDASRAPYVIIPASVFETIASRIAAKYNLDMTDPERATTTYIEIRIGEIVAVGTISDMFAEI